MLIKRFIDCRKGSVAPMLALAALPLFGFVGAAVDFSRAASVRTSMQTALDATVLMLAKDTQTQSDEQFSASFTSYFNSNFSHPDISNLNVTASKSSSIVTASATGVVAHRFMGLIGLSAMNVAVHAKAEATADGLGCVLSLHPNAPGATTGQGSTGVLLNGCSLYDNSDSVTALTVGGSAHITAYSVGVVGKVSGEENITTTQGIRTGMGIVKDPYAAASYPAFFGCTEQNFTAKNDITIDPGVYCNGITVHSGAVLTLNPGIYYLDGGSLTVNGGATLTGVGVTLVFTKKNKNDYATASINGNATINLKPPNYGSTAGIVIFGDRQMPVGTSFKFNGGAEQYLGGAIYVPTGEVSFSGGSSTSTSCTQLIAGTVIFTGNSNFALNCANYGTKPFSPTIVRLMS